MLQWMCNICLIVLAPQPGGKNVHIMYLLFTLIEVVFRLLFENVTFWNAIQVGQREVAFDILLCRDSTYLLPQSS